VSTPIHRLASVGSPLPPDDLHRRLRADPRGTVAETTADALSTCTPLLRRAGLPPRAVPLVTADEDGELGSVTIRWRGADDETGWPAMTAFLVVTPAGSGSLLTLYTSRVPGPELTTTRLGAVHRQRLARILVRAFLHALADHLRTVSTPTLQTAGAHR
jgi:hypothetical protein